MLLEEAVWRCTWTKAFPTLSPAVFDSDTDGDLWEKELAWRTVWSRFGKNQPQEPVASTVADHLWKESMGYGEITPQSALEIFGRIGKIRGDDIKWDTQSVTDLGSGSGLVLLVTLTAYRFRRVVGIELDPGLHCEALHNYEFWKTANQDSSGLMRDVDIEWRQGDFTVDTDWVLSSDIVICHATVFEDALVSRLNHLCSLCRSGTLFVMVTRALEHASIVTIESLPLEMNWGRATVFIQTKL